MTTFNDLVDEVKLNLAGYTMRQDRFATLTQPIDSDDLTLALSSVDNFGRGIAEIDEELVFIDSINRSTSSLVVAPWGRGQSGTAAVSHDANIRITAAPTFPTVSVKKAINDTIRSVYPMLFGVAKTTFTSSSARTTYQLPADAEAVLFVSWDTVGSSKEWAPVRRWRQDPVAASVEYGTGNSISIYDPIPSGRTIQVVYTKVPTALSSGTDVFETVTGLETASKEVIVLGAAYRLAAFIDPARLTFTSPEADENDSKRPFGSGANATRFLLALYQQRLNEEAGRLRDKYPIRVHFTV